MQEVSASASRIETERVETTQAGLYTCLTPTLASRSLQSREGSCSPLGCSGRCRLFPAACGLCSHVILCLFIREDEQPLTWGWESVFLSPQAL